MRAPFAIPSLLVLLAFALPVSAQIDVQKGREHWAYKPLGDADPPEVGDGDWPRGEVDRFLLAEMERRGLRPVGDAEKLTMIRRATYGLTGLPPTPEEIFAFLADRSADAFADLVDRLLASSAYGEHWGRHWLDVVRYADTSGSSSDHPVPEAYRYRNYVIDSFNSDKAFDQFVREQIAGDLLEASDDSDRRENIIATGYLAGARRFGVSGVERHLTIEDTIINLSEAFLATSVGCARCHDHTHDPIPTTDYYALYGIFASTRYPFPGAEMHKSPSDFVSLSGDPTERVKLENELRTLYEEFEALKAQRADEMAKERRREFRERIGEVRRQLAGFGDLAYAVGESDKIKDTPLMFRGNSSDRRDKVRRGFLQVLGGQQLPEKHRSSGRLELAGWITSVDNPLFARVIVNRIWAWHFGRGLVKTRNDFGAHGGTPSHPELLDYLARQFIIDGYSFKKMHRRLMLTRAYALSSEVADRDFEMGADPEAEFRWRFERRRLSAEELRDSLLAVAGLLDRSPGGAHPFPPKTEWGFTQHSPFYGDYRHERRSVYLMQQRIRRHPMLAVFDGADTNASTPEREQAASPVQALFLMNAPFAHWAASNFAARFVEATYEEAGRVAAAHHFAFGREADEADIALGQRFLADYRRSVEVEGEDPLVAEAKALAAYARVLLCSNEFIYVD